MNERAKRDICTECGALCGPREYHPHAFCVLVRAGYDPWQVVDAAKRHEHDRKQRSGGGV